MIKKIFHWGVVPKTFDPYKAPEEVTYCLCGLLDSEQSDHWIQTSTVVGKRNGNIVTRSGSEYQLESVNPDYELQFPNAYERVMKSLSEV